MTHPQISRDPAIMLGKPCIKGTRIPVETILKYLVAGESLEQLLEGYPGLTREDVLAAIAYAADYLHAEGALAA